jgi:hypothetical protein
MLFSLICTTIILSGITGFADFSQGAFFRGLGGQIMQGVLSIACFTLVGAAFWRFGWKIACSILFLLLLPRTYVLFASKKRLVDRRNA